MRYRTKPTYIEAVQFTRDNWTEIISFTNGIAEGFEIERGQNGRCFCHVLTDIGMHLVTEGDYIIKNKNGLFDVRRAEFFEEDYEAVMA